MGFPRGNVPWAGFGAEPQYKSVGDTAKLRFIWIIKSALPEGDSAVRFCFRKGLFTAASALTAMNRESYVRGNQIGVRVQKRPPGPICPPEDAEPVTCEPPEAVPPSETL